MSYSFTHQLKPQAAPNLPAQQVAKSRAAVARLNSLLQSTRPQTQPELPVPPIFGIYEIEAANGRTF